MEIIEAREMGFCFGVRDAIEAIEQATREHGRIDTLGQIVHNRQVVDRLNEQGARIVDTFAEIETPVMAITAHGVGPDVIPLAEQNGRQVIDTTCPIVTMVHQAVKKLRDEGFEILIFGEPNHVEVRGILGWAGERAVAATKWERGLIKRHGRIKLGIVSQTTQNVESFAAFVQAVTHDLMYRVSELRVVNTLCSAVARAQIAAEDLARETELVIVVGGQNSANTRHLAEIVREAGTEARHIQGPDEIEPTWLAGRARVGVTAGTSTPDDVIRSVVERLRELDPGR